MRRGNYPQRRFLQCFLHGLFLCVVGMIIFLMSQPIEAHAVMHDEGQRVVQAYSLEQSMGSADTLANLALRVSSTEGRELVSLFRNRLGAQKYRVLRPSVLVELIETQGSRNVTRVTILASGVPSAEAEVLVSMPQEDVSFSRAKFPQVIPLKILERDGMAHFRVAPALDGEIRIPMVMDRVMTQDSVQGMSIVILTRMGEGMGNQGVLDFGVTENPAVVQYESENVLVELLPVLGLIVLCALFMYGIQRRDRRF